MTQYVLPKLEVGGGKNVNCRGVMLTQQLPFVLLAIVDPHASTCAGVTPVMVAPPQSTLLDITLCLQEGYYQGSDTRLKIQTRSYCMKH